MSRWILLLLGCGHSLSAQGQHTLRPTLYGTGQALNYYNVAAGLADSTLNQSLWLYGQYKSVDSELWRKPVTLWASYLGRLKGHHDVYSVGYLHDAYSFFSRQTLYGGYTRQWTVLKRRTLSVGARALINLDRIRWTDWQGASRNGTDTHLTPDLDLGLAYTGRHLALGLSAKNLLGNTVRYDGETLLTNQREYYFSLAYTVYVGRQLTLAPFTLVRQGRGLDAELGARVGLFSRAWVGYQFRVWELRHIGSLVINPYKGLRLGISYDQSLVHQDHNMDALLGYAF